MNVPHRLANQNTTFLHKMDVKFAHGNLRVQFMYSYVPITILPNIMWCKNASPE